MKNIERFKSSQLSKTTASNLKGGIRYFTQSQVERRRKRRQLRKEGITYTDAIIICPITGLKTYCIEW